MDLGADFGTMVACPSSYTLHQPTFIFHHHLSLARRGRKLRGDGRGEGEQDSVPTTTFSQTARKEREGRKVARKKGVKGKGW
jgi:hypothetical protein